MLSEIKSFFDNFLQLDDVAALMDVIPLCSVTFVLLLASYPTLYQ